MLSAIIPTHDRPAPLRSCLFTLQCQEVREGELEVVVVDDGSDADIQAIVRDIEGEIPVRFERQQLGGLNAARNRGAEMARGSVLAFLDDDTLVSPGWARALLAAFERHRCAAVGGRVRLKLAAREPEWLAGCAHYLAQYDLGEEPRALSQDDPVPVGANCAIDRNAFEASGGFLVGLDRVGRSLLSNGDTELFRRLRAAGQALRYEPGASVLHCVPAERLTVRYFVSRHLAQGVSDELLMALEASRVTTAGYLFGLAREAGRSAWHLASEGVRRGRPIPQLFLLCYWNGRLFAAAREAVADKRFSSGDRREVIAP